VQTGLNAQLASDMWLTAAHWDSFDLANIFVNNLWMFMIVFVALGVLYYGYVQAQRGGGGI
jgi:hypothetical protein